MMYCKKSVVTSHINQANIDRG